MDRLSENEILIEKAKTGDSEAISRVIQIYQPDLRRFAREICQTSEDAEDAVQHALFIISTRMASFRNLSKFTSWAFAIVRNECLRLIRKWRRKTDPPETATDRRSIEQDFERSDILSRIGAALSNLDPIYRDVFLLRDVEGISAPEARRKLGISVAAVKSRLHRARAAIRTELGLSRPLR